MNSKLPATWFGQTKVPELLSNAKKLYPSQAPTTVKPKAILVPHAGWEYSGLCAASGYASFLNNNLDPINNIEYVIAISTYHKGDSGVFTTEKLNLLPSYIKVDKDLSKEHSLQIQLPFIEYCFPKAKILPIFPGNMSQNQMTKLAKFLDVFYNKHKDKCVWVINTDFLHAYPDTDFEYSLPTTNFLLHMLEVEKQFYELLLNIKNNSNQQLNVLMKKNTKYATQPTICGINALRLWCATDFSKQILGRLLCHYTSANIDTPLKYPPHKKEKVVGYCSIAYYNYDSNKLSSYNLQHRLSKFEELLLLDCAKRSVKIQETTLLPRIVCPSFRTKTGVFVTLKINDQLRGCIGNYTPNDTILNNIPLYANRAAYHDSRFSPLKSKEFKSVSWSINLLKSKKKIKNLTEWNLGKDGIILFGAIFLPSVPTEQGWNKEETLQELSKKAGRNKNDWKKSDTDIYSIPGYEFL